MTDPKDAAQRAAERIDQYLKWCELDYGDPTPCPEPHLEEQYQDLYPNDNIAINAAIIREELAKDKKVCVWGRSKTPTLWETECGISNATMNDKDNWCPHCGGKIEVSK